jgi:hypothetical protein
MKRKILLTISLLLFVIVSNAQLNGVYTIGGASPDYTTFSAAVTALTTVGVSGAVTFNVRNGTYVEKISIPAIAGASSASTITFESEVGDSSAVIIVDSASASSTNNYTLQLIGADFITIKNITIQRNGAGTYASVISIGNNSVNNKILNNHILGITATTFNADNSLVTDAAGGTTIDSNNVFSNNFFENGSFGMNYNGQSATVLEGRTSVTDNVFRNQYARYISMAFQSGPVIQGNDCATNSSYGSMDAIFLASSLKGLIARNKILMSSNSGSGIYLIGVDGTSNSPFIVANNMVHVGGPGTDYGLSMNSCSNFTVYYNSINLTGPGATSSCFYVTNSGSLGIDVLNNVFVNAGGGYAYYASVLGAAGIHISNFNDLYTSGAALCFWTSSTVADLAAFQSASGMEANSVSADPLFIAADDLHANGSAINDIGTPLAAPINIDFDGDLRSGTTPDLGADEFTPFVSTGDFSNEDALEVYPNPTSGYTVLAGLNVADGECKIIVRDLRGCEILMSTINGSSKKTSLDLSSLAEGAYVLTFITDQRVIGKMIHVMH